MSTCSASAMDASDFQSSPPPKERCNGHGHRQDALRDSFNPHRPRRSGAMSTTSRRPLTRSPSFNPHRPRRSGAIRTCFRR